MKGNKKRSVDQSALKRTCPTPKSAVHSVIKSLEVLKYVSPFPTLIQRLIPSAAVIINNLFSRFTGRSTNCESYGAGSL